MQVAQPPTSILDYDNYRAFLKDVLSEKSRKNPAFSLRAFARLTNISPSHLSRALSGQKRLSASMARQISVALNHSPEEADHFLSLVELENASDDDQKKSRILRRLSVAKEGKSRVVSLEAFRVIADWYHFAILSLMNTKGFQPDTHWIARRLGIKPLDARLALERLIGLGLVEKNGRTLKPVNGADLTTTDDVTSAAIQENHKQALSQAAEALTNVDVELREFNNLTLTMNLEDVPKAKRLIRTFLTKFNKEAETNPGQEVFQLNVQFYLLSRNERGQA